MERASVGNAQCFERAGLGQRTGRGAETGESELSGGKGASALFAFLLLSAPVAAPLLAQGGPPLVTDDPDTPGPRHWEVNFSVEHEGAHAAQREETLADINYGVGRRIQLKLEAPWVSLREEGLARETGPGNAIAGVKWRFLGEEGQRLAWSVYPQYEFNLGSSSAQKGLVPEGHRLILPTEFTLEIHRVELNFEVGRILASSGPDEWTYGVGTELGLSSRVELRAEVHGEKPDGLPTELLLNGGGVAKVNCKVALLMAVGGAVAGDPEDRPRLRLFGGVQLTFPGLFHFSQMASLRMKECKGD